MTRLYNADIVECEESLYENLDALIEYAKKYPSEFVTYTDIEVVEVKINDDSELQIDYLLNDIDDNDNDVQVPKSETFSYSYKDMMTLVA